MQISEVHLLTNSLLETKLFYVEKLGFKVVEQTDELLCFEVGVSKLWFHQSDAVEKPVYHFAFDIPENQLEAGLEWMRSKAELIPYAKDQFIIDFPNWNAKSFYFYDNNGNILEGIVRYDLLNICNEPFGGNSFLRLAKLVLQLRMFLPFATRLTLCTARITS